MTIASFSAATTIPVMTGMARCFLNSKPVCGSVQGSRMSPPSAHAGFSVADLQALCDLRDTLI
jgi:hypothetical protein